MMRLFLSCVYYWDTYERRETDEQKHMTQPQKNTDFVTNDDKHITRRGALLFLSRRESISGERPTSFPKKIQPSLTRDSNPNPLGYKPKVIATILAGRHMMRYYMEIKKLRCELKCYHCYYLTQN
ncbi:hypothetical protein TNCV_4122351 [Trichonephila clavipes]|nr:hypothetical protein TNCV_4122351 [Trichonephila clavipes]